MLICQEARGPPTVESGGCLLGEREREGGDDMMLKTNRHIQYASTHDGRNKTHVFGVATQMQNRMFADRQTDKQARVEH